MNGDETPGQLTKYEQSAWDELQQWRSGRLATRTRRRLPPAVRDRIGELGAKARSGVEAVPGAAEFEKIFLKALEGLLGLGSRGAIATVPRAAIVDAYR